MAEDKVKDKHDLRLQVDMKFGNRTLTMHPHVQWTGNRGEVILFATVTIDEEGKPFSITANDWKR